MVYSSRYCGDPVWASVSSHAIVAASRFAITVPPETSDFIDLDLVGPHGHLFQHRRAERRHHRDVERVPAPSDEHTAGARLVVARVEGEPRAAEEDLGPRTEVHWIVGRRDADVGKVPEGVTGRDPERPAERHRQVREVAAHTPVLLVHLDRGGNRRARAVTELHVCRGPSRTPPARDPTGMVPPNSRQASSARRSEGQKRLGNV